MESIRKIKDWNNNWKPKNVDKKEQEWICKLPFYLSMYKAMCPFTFCRGSLYTDHGNYKSFCTIFSSKFEKFEV